MNKRTFIISFLFLALLAVLINQQFVKYVYVNPQTNVNVLPYITKSIKPIEKNLNFVMSLCRKDYKDMRYVYKNYYGSGFLKENQIPNDLDISVGVDLGTYKYDGSNEHEIAVELEDKILLYHVYSYSAFEGDKKYKYVLDQPSIKYTFNMQNKSKETINNIENGLKNVMRDKLQVKHFNKKYKENDVDYTFILKQNEVLVNEIAPLFAFTKGVLYNKNMLNYPREITILPDFYVTIIDTKTNKTKHIELIEESFLGERFQISRRFFVPIVFTGNNSLKYIKNLDYLKDDEQYFEMRMFNYFRYLDEVSLYFEYTVDPVKLVKRMHQCTDLINPALTTEEKEKIYSDILDVLDNEGIKTVNEYTNIIKNLTTLTSNPQMFHNANDAAYIKGLINASGYILAKMAQNKEYKDEITTIDKFQKEFLVQISSLNSAEKLLQLNRYLNDRFIDISVELTKIVNKNVPDKQKYVKDYEILANVAKNAGFHQINIYRKDEKTIFIMKDDFTKTLSSEDLKQLAKENNMPDVNYVLINENSLQKGSRSEVRYVRYKSSNSENEYYKELKQKMLEDKKNFKIKRKYVF